METNGSTDVTEAFEYKDKGFAKTGIYRYAYYFG